MTTRSQWGAARLALLAVLLMLPTAGCQSELLHGLSEPAANEMIVVLEQHGFQADKSRDPGDPEAFVVTVPGGVQVDAWRVLQAEGLPRPQARGFGDFYPSQGLVPTSGEERVLLQYATAQELRNTLLTVDGLIDAQVNLVLPERSRVRLSSETPTPPRASVLVKYRPDDDGAAPMSPVEIQSLIAGGVDSLDVEAVTVVMTPGRRGLEPLQQPRLETVGPVAVAPANKAVLQGMMLGLLGIIGFLVGAVIFLVLKRKRG